jgi:HEPN domain-containing protein
MNSDRINIEKTVNHWISRSDQDFDTLLNMYNTKDYHWALFIGHLVIERLLKALIVKKTGNHAPLTHDLRRLAKLAELDLATEQKRYLDTITTFNLNARYDDYKKDFYKKCTAEYAQEWISNIEILRGWIKEML